VQTRRLAPPWGFSHLASLLRPPWRHRSAACPVFVFWLRLALRLFGRADRVEVERAIAEIRTGRPVLIATGAGSALAVGAEGLDPDLCTALDPVAGDWARLVLTAARLRHVGLDRLRAGTIALPNIENERIAALAWTLDARIDAPVGSPAPVDEDALELTRLALLLPAALAIPVPPGVALDAAVLSVFRAAIRSFRQAQVRDLRIVAPAPVPLEGALGTEFVVFSGGEGLRDLVAILVGRPDLTELVAVRLHSACLTGDLFGSLSLAASATSGRPNTGAATYCSPRSA
jgi:GTP cyclohydrolase II